MTGAAAFRVLLYGHVNLNVIDGSAFFVPATASMLASLPGVEVDVVAANPIQRAVVVAEALARPRVRLFDPYHDVAFDDEDTPWREKALMRPDQAAGVLLSYWDRRAYDVCFVRNTEVGAHLVRQRPDLAPHLLLYVTGLRFDDEPVDEAVERDLRVAADAGATLVVQTPEMLTHLHTWVRGSQDWPIVVMSPAVPPAEPGLPVGTSPSLTAVYAGKFARDWNTLPMLAGFKQARAEDDRLRLVVAGDHFMRDTDRPTFGKEAQHLLTTTPGVTWLGAVTRTQARGTVRAADVGLSWRGPGLARSLELSTKLLEYGVLGRPSVINRTAMHERVFGADYPLFADSMREYVDLLLTLARDRELLTEAAHRMSEAAAASTYPRVAERLLPTLVTRSRRALAADVTPLVTRLASGADGARSVTDEAGRTVVSWLVDDEDAARLVVELRRRRTTAVSHLGPLAVLEVEDREGPSDPAEDLPLLTVLASATGRPADAAVADVPDATEAIVRHDADGRVHVGAVPPSPGSNADQQKRIAELEKALRQEKRRADRLEQRYTALAGTPLGRTQRRYWEMRSRRRND